VQSQTQTRPQATGQTAFIAGGTGALGGRIIRRLSGAGFIIHASGRDQTKLDALSKSGVITHSANQVPEVSVDVIINAAGIGGGTYDAELLHAANVAMLDPLIALAKANPSSLLIQLSSPSTQFCFEHRFGISEDEPFSKPISPYAFSKQLAETKLCAVPSLNWCILRLRAGYGAGSGSFISLLQRRIASKASLPLINNGKAQIDLVHVDDIADAVLSICSHPKQATGLVANIAGPEPLAFADIVDALAAAQNISPRFLKVSPNVLLSAAQLLDRAWKGLALKSEPPISLHMAGSLVYSQTLGLSSIKAATGWEPKRRFADWVSEEAKTAKIL
jgi:2-alkyl-3-oxoalkanoate reductase